MVDAGTQVSGTIQTLDVDFNARVKAGQVIARLDPSIYDSRVIEAQAALIQAQAELAGLQVTASDAEVKLERGIALAKQGLITQAELDAVQMTSREAAAAVKAGAAAVRSATAMLDEARITRARTIIRAPIDGVVIDRPVEVGQTLAASFNSPVVYTIADLREMQLIASVDEADVGTITTGTPVTFQISSREGEEFTGTVADVRLQPIDTLGSTTTTGASGTGGTGASATAPVGTAGRSGGATGATSAATVSAPAGAAPTGPAGAVVSYQAVIDVANPDETLAPGTTAILKLPTARRSNVVRIPNTALAFRPSPAVLDALGEPAPKMAVASDSDNPAAGRMGYVWKYEQGRLVPIAVRTGVSDDRWTELLSGDVDPGDQLVTDASATR